MNISIQDYLTSQGKYPYRDKSPELTLELRLNAGKLLEAVNGLLKDLGIDTVAISSGFRTFAANNVAGGAPTSAHCQCLAIDIVDTAHAIYDKCETNLELLEKWGIYLEHKSKTPNWIHMTIRRPGSGRRIFMP